ncbi:MAG: M56 family metallopeptidase [Syntrophomonas sp.]|nr:M56 family metallopeptidase [Syntrophomonas sp.]
MSAVQGVSSIFDWIVLSSLMGSILVFLILVVKFAFKSTLGAIWHYYIWFLLLLKLIIPFIPESPVSMYNFVKLDSLQSVFSNQPDSFVKIKTLSTETGNSPGKLAINTIPLASNLEQVKTDSAAKPIPTDFEVVDWKAALIILWLIGVALLLGYTILINLKLWYQIRTEPKANSASIIRIVETCKLEMNITNDIPLVITNKASTPALFGPIKPWLLLPDSFMKSLTDIELKYIVFHELAHWKRKDIIINWLTVVVQILHWFNPIIWYGFYRMHQDCELACDALVLSSLKPEKHKEYGHAIIRVLEMTLTPQWVPGTTRMLSQKSNIKRRIRMISKFKRESLSISIITIIVFIAMGMVGCTNAPNADVLQSGNSADKSSYNQLSLDLKNNQMLAGAVDVEGQGIVVTLSDGDSSPIKDRNLLVHDADIRNVINQLIVAEAEAISVNDERLIASSAIEAGGAKIIINSKSYTSPFVIKAIGNSEKMVNNLESKGGPVEFLRYLGQGITIEKSESLLIPKYKGEVNFKYAKPVENKNA